MIISAIDLDNWDKNPFTIEYDDEETFIQCYGTSKEIYLPPCNESHEIIGNYFLSNMPLKTTILNESLVIKSEDYGYRAEKGFIRYDSLPTIYFIQVPGWELIISRNPFLHKMDIFFKQKVKHNVSATRMSLR